MNQKLTKTSIIEIIAFTRVPENAKLVRQGAPAFPGITITRIDPESAGALRIVIAEMLQESIVSMVADLGEVPDATLMRRLHESLVFMTRQAIQSVTMDASEWELVDDHRAMIAKLREMAAELGLEYQPPTDPFLEEGK